MIHAIHEWDYLWATVSSFVLRSLQDWPLLVSTLCSGCGRSHCQNHDTDANTRFLNVWPAAVWQLEIPLWAAFALQIATNLQPQNWQLHIEAIKNNMPAITCLKQQLVLRGTLRGNLKGKGDWKPSFVWSQRFRCNRLGLTMPAGLLGAAAVAGAANTLWQYNREMLGQAVSLEEREVFELIWPILHCIFMHFWKLWASYPRTASHTMLYTRYHLMQEDGTSKDKTTSI